MPILANSTSKTSTHVTLGIGGDITAEEKLVKLYPDCQLFGADPSKQSGTIFTKIGKYFEIAVGAKTGSFKHNVLSSAVYTSVNATTISLIDFLQQKINKRFIDFLWIDIEGSEYDLLPQFTEGGVLYNSKIIICQMNVEAHGPLTDFKSNFTAFGRMMTSLMEKSDFLLIKATFVAGHWRMYWINTKNEMCVKKYFEKC